MRNHLSALSSAILSERGKTDMTLKTFFWIICGAIWGFIILAAIGTAVINRIRNRDKNGE